MKKYIVTSLKAGVLPCMLLIASPFAVGSGHGRISMQGSIIDTACSIRMEDRYQIVEIGVQAVGQLMTSPKGLDTPLVIRLENCALHSDGAPAHSWSRFQVTFDGATDDGVLFSVPGTARGVGLEIVDDQGNAAVPGEPMPGGSLGPSELALNYRMHLKGNARHLKSGEYKAVIRFKVDYF